MQQIYKYAMSRLSCLCGTFRQGAGTGRAGGSARWKEVGDVSALKSLKDRTYTTKPTSRFVQDDNELRLGSVSLGYTFNRQQLRKIGISALRLQLSTEDLFTLSSIKQERGTTYPFARTYNFSLNFTL